MVMVKEYSPGKGESTCSSESTQAPPATCPSIVGVCAWLISKVQAYHFITCYCRREDCPRGTSPGHAGYRPARALAVRPLQAPRAWPSRFDCRQWRRRSATSGSEKSAGRVVGEALRSTCVYHDRLGVKRSPFCSTYARLARYDFYSPWDAYPCIPTVYVVVIGHEPSTVSRSCHR